jgi:hypothetical protein
MPPIGTALPTFNQAMNCVWPGCLDPAGERPAPGLVKESGYTDTDGQARENSDSPAGQLHGVPESVRAGL